jgi:hypothetical protein
LWQQLLPDQTFFTVASPLQLWQLMPLQLWQLTPLQLWQLMPLPL